MSRSEKEFKQEIARRLDTLDANFKELVDYTSKLTNLVTDYMERINDLAHRVEELEKQKGLIIT